MDEANTLLEIYKHGCKCHKGKDCYYAKTIKGPALGSSGPALKCHLDLDMMFGNDRYRATNVNRRLKEMGLMICYTISGEIFIKKIESE